MRFSIKREKILRPLQWVASVVERRKTFPILANILIKVTEQHVTLIATDTEIQIVTEIALNQPGEPGETTVPGKKLLDICRSLPEDAVLEFSLEKEHLNIRAKRSKFSLATLPAKNFPNIDETQGQLEFSLLQKDLRSLIEHSYFAMAQQDIRFFLNGILLEINQQQLIAVGADGHRLALAYLPLTDLNPGQVTQVILPRKAVLELLRLLDNPEDKIDIRLCGNHIRLASSEIIFTSKLIDGRFPDYQNVIPKASDKILLLNRENFRQILSRASILSNERFRGVSIQLRHNLLKVQAHNPEQEEAEDCLEISYDGGDLDIGFNVSYILEALSAMSGEQVRLGLNDADSSMLLQDPECKHYLYIVMPMRL